MQAIQHDSSKEQKEKGVSYLEKLLPSLFQILGDKEDSAN